MITMLDGIAAVQELRVYYVLRQFDANCAKETYDYTILQVYKTSSRTLQRVNKHAPGCYLQEKNY